MSLCALGLPAQEKSAKTRQHNNAGLSIILTYLVILRSTVFPAHPKRRLSAVYYNGFFIFCPLWWNRDFAVSIEKY
jgi:hypothetical protein